MYVWLIVLFCR